MSAYAKDRPEDRPEGHATSRSAGRSAARSAGRPHGRRDMDAIVRDAVVKAGSRRVAELAQELEVSEVTIRKSLNSLERQGLIRRFHGEARAWDGDDIPFRMGLFYEEKQHIAELAAGLVSRGDTILIEAGSAAAFLAEKLKGEKDLTVITANLFIARIFRGTRVRVVVSGGAYQEESESLVGPVAAASIRSLGFSKAFLGVSGWTAETGFTLNDFARAEISRAILARGAENYILTDSSKFGRAHTAGICSDLSLICGVITDPLIPPECRAALVAGGTRVLN